MSIQREAVAEELAQLAVQEADLDEEELQYHRDCNKYQQRLGEVYNKTTLRTRGRGGGDAGLLITR